MKRLKVVFSELSIATLFALAIAGLVFPASLFAQPRVAGFDDLIAGGHVQIDILELDENGFPAVVTAESGGRKLRYELGEGSFHWVDMDNPKLFGSDVLPDLNEIATWEIELEPEGSFRAAIPYGSFQPSAEVLPELVPLSKLGEQELAGEMVDTFGAFDPEARSFELSAVLPGGQLVDMTVSLAALPLDAQLGGSGPIGELSEKYWVFVGIAVILTILGLIVISCIGIIAACGFICNYTCPFGVINWNAQCGFNGGCNCNCDRPKPPICDGFVDQSDALKVTGGEALVLPSSPFTLTRLEKSDRVHHGQPVSFLMGEWALVSYGVELKSGSPRLEVLRASSPDYAASQLAGLEAAVALQAKGVGSGPHTALLVARPDHGANSRQIPLPRLRLSKSDRLAGLDDGRVLVRADFSEDRELQGFEVLHETVGGLSAKVERELRQSLGLEYASEASHRTVVFAVLELAGGEVELIDELTYLPKCCCGGQFCV